MPRPGRHIDKAVDCRVARLFGQFCCIQFGLQEGDCILPAPRLDRRLDIKLRKAGSRHDGKLRQHGIPGSQIEQAVDQIEAALIVQAGRGQLRGPETPQFRAQRASRADRNRVNCSQKGSSILVFHLRRVAARQE